MDQVSSAAILYILAVHVHYCYNHVAAYFAVSYGLCHCIGPSTAHCGISYHVILQYSKYMYALISNGVDIMATCMRIMRPYNR